MNDFRRNTLSVKLYEFQPIANGVIIVYGVDAVKHVAEENNLGPDTYKDHPSTVERNVLESRSNQGIVQKNIAQVHKFYSIFE